VKYILPKILILCWSVLLRLPVDGAIVSNVGMSSEDSLVVAVVNWDSAGLAPISADSFWFNVFRLEDVDRVHAYLDSLPETGKVISLATTMAMLPSTSNCSIRGQMKRNQRS